MQDTLKKLARGHSLLRYWEWQPKVVTILVAIFVLVIYLDSSQIPFPEILLVIFYLYVGFSFGYLANSYADRQKDLLVDKDIYFGFSERKIKTGLFVLGVLLFGIPFMLGGKFAITLGLFILFLGYFYSAHPFRFKERSIMGPIVSAATHRLPLLFLYPLIEPKVHSLLFFLFGWLFLGGVMAEISHQVVDYKNDKKSMTKTFVGDIGLKNAEDILYVFFVFLVLYVTGALYIFGVSSKSLFCTALLFIFSYDFLYSTFDAIWYKKPI
jgi:4-hydroxybenzoate polyprenyltransferase